MREERNFISRITTVSVVEARLTRMEKRFLQPLTSRSTMELDSPTGHSTRKASSHLVSHSLSFLDSIKTSLSVSLLDCIIRLLSSRNCWTPRPLTELLTHDSTTRLSRSVLSISSQEWTTNSRCSTGHSGSQPKHTIRLLLI